MHPKKFQRQVCTMYKHIAYLYSHGEIDKNQGENNKIVRAEQEQKELKLNAQLNPTKQLSIAAQVIKKEGRKGKKIS